MVVTYVFHAETPFSGTSNERTVVFSEEPALEELEEIAEEFRIENAADYDYLVFGWDNAPEDEEDEEQLNKYYNDCECWYEKVEDED